MSETGVLLISPFIIFLQNGPAAWLCRVDLWSEHHVVPLRQSVAAKNSPRAIRQGNKIPPCRRPYHIKLIKLFKYCEQNFSCSWQGKSLWHSQHYKSTREWQRHKYRPWYGFEIANQTGKSQALQALWKSHILEQKIWTIWDEDELRCEFMSKVHENVEFKQRQSLPSVKWVGKDMKL